MSESRANTGDNPAKPISDELRITLARFAGINADTYGVEDTPSVAELERYIARSKSDKPSEESSS